MRSTHCTLLNHHAATPHPTLTQEPPQLPPDLDLTLLPPRWTEDQLTYLADFLADFRAQTLSHMFALLLTTPPGYTPTITRYGANVILLSKLLGLNETLRSTPWRELPNILHCSKDYIPDAKRALLATLRRLAPRAATMLDRLGRADKVTPANTARKHK